MAKKPSNPGPAKKPAAPAAMPAKAAATPGDRTSAVRNSPLPKVTPAAAKTITQEMIAKRAYEISQSGTGAGELDNWLRAERELREQNR